METALGLSREKKKGQVVYRETGWDSKCHCADYTAETLSTEPDIIIVLNQSSWEIASRC